VPLADFRLIRTRLRRFPINFVHMQSSFLKACGLLLLTSAMWAEGTQLWQQSKFDEFEKGTSNGIAIASDGKLQLAPSLKSIYTSPSTYIWQVVSDTQGNAYLGAGSPARVYRVTPDGKATTIFEAKELQVQAMAIDADGTIYAATSPDGRVYKLEPNAPPAAGTKKGKTTEEPAKDSDKSETSGAEQTYRSSVFYDPKTKYIWDIELDPAGPLYVATGDHGEIYKVERNGEGSLFFKSDEAHIRSLALLKPPAQNEDTKRKKNAPPAPSTVIAGSDGSGLVYRISPAGEAFVLYSAPKKEITAVATDSAGNIYAAGVGEKHGGAAAPIAPASAPVTSSATPATPPAALPSQISGGSEIYIISADGSPNRIWSSKEDLVYSLTFGPDGQLLAGTGNRGHIYAIPPGSTTGIYRDLLKLSANQITSMALASNGAIYAVTANLGKLFVLGPARQQEGTYESDVFDARSFSHWGRAEVRGSGDFDFFARSGNVDNPDRNWSPWTKIDLKNAQRLPIPPARFVQWKVALHPSNAGSHVESVALNYLPKNIAPVIDDIAVEVGARITSFPTQKPTNESVTIPLGSTSAIAPAHFDTPPAAVKDRDYIAVRWAAHDDNDDDLVYSIYYRGDNETDWKLLKDNITEKYYSWDSSLLPDGGYVVKIVSSDAPSHSPEEALSDERVSPRFEVDSTPPVVQALQAKVEGNTMHITFRAADSFSPIKHAEYSIDAGDWHYIEPVGQISDSPTEEYDFSAALPQGEAAVNAVNSGKKSGKRSRTRDGGTGADIPQADQAQVVNPGEHVVVVRVWDRFDNMSAAKVVTK
jgi:outer membrane protein assembly factor BamB